MSEVITIPAGCDNYMYLIVCGTAAAVVDPTVAGPVMAVLVERGLSLKYILITHGHGDHTGGVKVLKQRTGAHVVGPDRSVPEVDEIVAEGTTCALASDTICVIATPGHTAQAASYYLISSNENVPGAVFTGDTLFIGGCGRVFGSTAEMLWNSLQKLAALPDETTVYAGHEYTVENYEFATVMFPDDAALKDRLHDVTALRKKGVPTVPSTMLQEKTTNVFMRARTAREFAELRRRKDVF